MTLQEKILDHLRKEAGEVSGEALSKKLKVSRTAVWKQIERLRQEGYSIESSTKRGYRLTQEIDKL
ncbi:MAG: HTH domain-containing protein, partial [bacterium]